MSQPWTFEISSQKQTIMIPDRGGQMDMVPRDPAQLDWAMEALAPLSGIERIWPTVFQAASDDALDQARRVIRSLGEVQIRES